MELSREQLDFLQECEEEFKNRYTDADEDFFKIKCSALTNPPILDPWPCGTQKSKNKNQRDSYDRHSQRRDSGRDNGRYKEDRYRDGRRNKQKRRSRNERERSRERSADRRREKDERRSAGRKRRKHRKRSEDRSKGYRDERRDRRHRDEERDRRQRDEERDRRHRRENIERDEYYYGGRGRSRDRQSHRETDFDGKEYEQKKKDAETCVHKSPEISVSSMPQNSQNNVQDFWTTYVSKHNLYENYRPYF